MTLDYAQLVAKFEDNLLHTLRSHGVDLDYLAMWVPDVDPVKGILNMVEAAQAFGEAHIAIAVSAELVSGERLAKLESLLAEVGEVSVEPQGSQVVLRIDGLQDGTLFQDIHVAFRAAIRDRFRRLDHEALPAARPALRRLVAEGPVARLAVVLDDHGIILAAGHDGAADAAQRAVLDAFCALIEGLPLREAGDHGVLRLIYQLRDAAKPWPFAGVVFPPNCDAVFAAPLALIRELHADYAATGAAEPAINEYDPPVAASWAALSPEARLAQITASVGQTMATKGLQPDDAHVLRLDNDLRGKPVRVFMTFSDQVQRADKAKLMRVIEADLRKLESKLTVFHETLKDQSGIRRL
jgi:hypothetical protein